RRLQLHRLLGRSDRPGLRPPGRILQYRRQHVTPAWRPHRRIAECPLPLPSAGASSAAESSAPVRAARGDSLLNRLPANSFATPTGAHVDGSLTSTTPAKKLLPGARAVPTF